jgi:uncharacterized protein (DUF433 family)
MYIGDVRVTTQNQSLSLQLDALDAAGCAKVFVEQASGVQRNWPQQQAALDCGRLGDTLVVWKLDRLPRQLWVAPSMLYRHLPGKRSAFPDGRARCVGSPRADNALRRVQMHEDMTYPHITLNSSGVPCIDGTRHRVIDIVADHVAHGYSAAQIVEQYPDLTPAQVHAALTYYYDHQDAMDTALVASYAQAEHQRHHHTLHPKLVAARARQAG